jgi:vitamin B12 transporter
LKKSSISAAAVGLAVPFTLFSAQCFADLNEVTVTGTRSIRPVLDALADITVIDRASIQNGAYSSVIDLLQAQAGVEVTQQGGQGKLSGVFLRGTKTAQTLILVDGVRLENPLSGGANLEFLPLSMIDRIEISRGPASSFYGSAAMGGVIQIFTRQGADQPKLGVSTFGSVTLGSQHSANAAAGVGISREGLRWQLSVSRDQSQGFEATRAYSSSYQIDRDSHRQNAINFSVAASLNKESEIGLNTFSTWGRTYYDSSFSLPADTRLSFRTGNLAVYYKSQLTDQWATELRWGQSRIAYDYYDASGFFPFAPKSLTTNLAWTNRISLGGKNSNNSLFAGLETAAQSVTGPGIVGTSSSYAATSRKISSVFGGYENKWDNHSLRWQVRRDTIDSEGAVADVNAKTGTLAYGYRLSNAWQFRASGGSAFRAPTFDDLYNPFGPNPNLKPEKSVGFEAGVERRLNGQFVKITAFSQKIKQAIELDSSFVSQNFDATRIAGATIDLREQVGQVLFKAHLTKQRAEGTYTDFSSSMQVTGPLARRAKTHGSVSMQWAANPTGQGFRAGGDWQLQSSRTDTDGARLGGYGVLNLSSSYLFSPASTGAPSWALFGKVGNVFAKRYELASGYNASPRYLLIGVRYQ